MLPLFSCLSCFDIPLLPFTFQSGFTVIYNVYMHVREQRKRRLASLMFTSPSVIFLGDQIGHLILGGGCLFGVGSLCYYGMGLSVDAGAIDRAG